MAKTTDATRNTYRSLLGTTGGNEVIKDLLDNLIVPQLVEDYLRLHGHVGVAKAEDNHARFDSGSEDHQAS